MPIPKIIHHIAPKNKKKWHPMWKVCYDSWKSNFPENEYEYILWNDKEDIDLFIKNEYPQYWKIYKKLPSHMLKIDFARIAIIYRYGGIFSDMDIYCYQNFYKDFDNKDCCLVECTDWDGLYNKEDEIVVNFFLAAKPNHVFFKDVLEKMVVNRFLYDKKTLKNILSDHKKYSYHVIEHCIMLMSRLYRTYDKSLIHILPRNNYNISMFTYHKNKKIQHMFTGMWGNDILDEMERQRMQIIEDNGENLSYDEYLKKQYKDKTSLDMDNFKYIP